MTSSDVTTSSMTSQPHREYENYPTKVFYSLEKSKKFLNTSLDFSSTVAAAEQWKFVLLPFVIGISTKK